MRSGWKSRAGENTRGTKTVLIQKLFFWQCAIILALFSCGIENFESLADLHPPLGLTASSSGGKIFLEFSALNPEENFAGYSVFIGDDETAVINQEIELPNEITREPPFTNHEPFYSARYIELTVTKYTNNLPLPVDAQIYIGVAAYDARNQTNSRTSNVTNVIIQQ